MTRAIPAFLLLLVAVVAWAGGQPSVQVRTAKVQRQTLRDSITAFGLVSPDPEAQTTRAATYTAFVQRLNVTLGQAVNKGDPLLTLRTGPVARATYLSAQTTVQHAREALARKRKLLQQHLATRADVNAAEQALSTAEAAFTAQQALGTGQKTHIIKAPFTGIVAQLPVKTGNQVQAGTELFQLARRDRLQVALGVEPDVINRVQPGLAVKILPVFGRGNGVNATVTKVQAVVDPNTRLVDVVVPLSGAQAQPFLPGMRVQGQLTLATARTLAVPRSAVLHDQRGDYLFVVADGKARRVTVHTGLEQNGWIGVEGTLTPGEPVVTEGNYELSDGMPVRPSS